MHHGEVAHGLVPLNASRWQVDVAAEKPGQPVGVSRWLCALYRGLFLHMASRISSLSYGPPLPGSRVLHRGCDSHEKFGVALAHGCAYALQDPSRVDIVPVMQHCAEEVGSASCC